MYQPDNEIKLEVRLEDETVWLNRQQLSELFNRDVKTIGKHISNALKEELAGLATVANFATVQKEGERTVTRHVEYYNLDMILSVGYRVKSNRGIEFRRWANSVLKEYLLKGYSVNRRLTELEHTVAEHSRKEVAETAPCQYSVEELEHRLGESVQSYRKGDSCTSDELRKRHPVCE